MPNYWVMAPFDSDKAKQFDQIWKYDCSHNVISIGWDVGPFDSPDELENRLQAKVAEQVRLGHKPWGPHGLRQLKRFWYEVSEGDLIIARQGLSKVVGLAKVKSSAYYNADMAKDQAGSFCKDHAYFRNVRWNDFDKRQASRKLHRHTILPINEDRFRQLIGGTNS